MYCEVCDRNTKVELKKAVAIGDSPDAVYYGCVCLDCENEIVSEVMAVCNHEAPTPVVPEMVYYGEDPYYAVYTEKFVRKVLDEKRWLSCAVGAKLKLDITYSL